MSEQVKFMPKRFGIMIYTLFHSITSLMSGFLLEVWCVMLVSILALSLMYEEHKMHLLPFCALSSSKLVMFTLITLFDSFSSLNCAAPGKTLLCPGRRRSIHIGHWTKTGMGIKSLIFLKDSKSACKNPTPSQNWWLTDICAARHVWRMLKGAVSDHLET